MYMSMYMDMYMYMYMCMYVPSSLHFNFTSLHFTS